MKLCWWEEKGIMMCLRLQQKSHKRRRDFLTDFFTAHIWSSDDDDDDDDDYDSDDE